MFVLKIGQDAGTSQAFIYYNVCQSVVPNIDRHGVATVAGSVATQHQNVQTQTLLYIPLTHSYKFHQLQSISSIIMWCKPRNTKVTISAEINRNVGKHSICSSSKFPLFCGCDKLPQTLLIFIRYRRVYKQGFGTWPHTSLNMHRQNCRAKLSTVCKFHATNINHTHVSYINKICISKQQ